MILRATRLSATGNNSSFRLDSDAEAYINEILLRGANPTFGQRNQINAFVLAEKSSNRWSLHRRIYFPVWGVAAANAVDMVTRTSGSFGGGVTHGAGFAQGNGSSGFFDMLVSPVAAGLAPGNACYWAHVLQAGSGTGFRAIQGSTQVGSRALASARNAGITSFSMGDTSGGVTANLTATDTDGRGIYIASETATNSRFLRVRRSSGIALSTTNTAIPTSPTFATVSQRVFCWNNGGSNGGFTDAQLSGYGLSLALSTADADNFTLNLQNLWENVVFEGFDPDAVDFIRATGASDYQAINNWVVGLKNLGIWNNIVSWPMRSTQNHGSGTVLRSLGGLGSFNGTLTNGPSWTTTGISFDGANDFIEIPNPQQSTALSAYSIWSVFDSDQTVGRTVFGSYNTGLTIGPTIFAGSSPLQGSGTTTIFHDLSSDGTTQIGAVNNDGRRFLNGNTGSWQTAFSGFGGTQLGMSVNGGSRQTQVVSSTTAWNNNATWRMGARVNGAAFYVGQQAMNLYANIYLTPTQAVNLRNLYVSTLGAGLGLP